MALLALVKGSTSKEANVAVELVAPEIPNNREKLTLFHSNGCWWVSQGIPLEPGYREQKLTCGEDARFLSVIEAIEQKYGDRYLVVIDLNVTKNPFVRHHLSTVNNFGMTPDYPLIQKAFDNPGSRKCTICNGEAWYNGRVSVFECYKCGAHEVGGSFMKIRRRR